MAAAQRAKISRNGSTVHLGGFDCECFGCTLGEMPNVARWSCWRISNHKIKTARRNGHVRSTWIMCDSCRREGKRLDPASTSPLFIEHDIYLPLLHPSDPYARIAVEEMLYAVASLGASCAARTRVDSHPRCGFDVYGFGTRKTKNPCRARATQVAEEFLDLDTGGDLYLCDRHAKTMKRRERNGGGEFTTSLVLDFDAGGAR